MLPPLSEWETFYVIIGSSAAALTGLQFVVIALSAEARAAGGEAELQAFATPTVVHFCSVLLVSAILSMPKHTPGTLSLCITITGLAGLGYAVWVFFQTRRQTHYQPVLEDWIWHAVLPHVAYLSLLIVGLCIRTHPEPALYFVAVTALLLLYIGIHNAWDAALFLAVKKKEERSASEPQ
jgi:hypothetical protein